MASLLIKIISRISLCISWNWMVAFNRIKINRTRKEYSKVYVCGTYYHLFVSIVCQIKDQRKDNVILIANSISSAEKIQKKLREIHLFERVELIDEYAPYRFVYSCQKLFYFSRKQLINSSKGAVLFPFEQCREIVVFNDCTPLGYNLQIFGHQYSIYEDGRDCYALFSPEYIEQFIGKINPKSLYIRRFLSYGQHSFGTSISVKAIYVNNPTIVKCLPQWLLRKMDKQELIETLSMSERNSLRYVMKELFDFPEIEDGSALVLLTQLDEVCEREIQIEDILFLVGYLQKNYCGNYKTYIKPHPRDKHLFYDAVAKKTNTYMIDRFAPSEIFEVMNVHLSKVIAVETTARVFNAEEFIDLKGVSSLLNRRHN